MKHLVFLLLLTLTTSVVMGDTLSLIPPTKYEDGTALARSDITSFTFYRAGVRFAQIPGTSTSAVIPPTCERVTWTSTATAKGLESKHSNTAIQGISPKCSPNVPIFRATQ